MVSQIENVYSGFMRKMKNRRLLLVFLNAARAAYGSLWMAMVLWLAASAGHASIINVSPADGTNGYAKIEAARAGDEVVIAPGTYTFRVHLTAKGSVTNPIYIQAQDPGNKPVWDLSSTLVENAPGSYTAGDRGRGGWQVDGGTGYHISGIVFAGCHTAGDNSAGLRYYNGATNLILKDCVFVNNDNGLTGGTQNSEALAEFCEFATNGNLAASSPTHNMYIFGGTFTLRYCYVHDSLQAQNFHVRAQNSTIEYNWFARAASYEGDLMVDDDFSDSGPFTQTMLLRGNVFVQNSNPGNHSQVMVIFNDTGLSNENMSMTVVNNTYVGNGIPGNGGGAAFVHLSNAKLTNGTIMSAQVANNIIFGTTQPVLVEDLTDGTVTGSNTWLATGVNPGPLAGTVFSSAPGFKNAAANDFTLSNNSVVLGRAAQLAAGMLPVKEYYRDQIVAREYRIRNTAGDIGAFESTTGGAGIGAYDAPPAPRVSAAISGGAVIISWPLTAPEFVLEQTTALSGGSSWAPFAGTLATNYNGFSATVPLPVNQSYYRLRMALE